MSLCSIGIKQIKTESNRSSCFRYLEVSWKRVPYFYICWLFLAWLFVKFTKKECSETDILSVLLRTSCLTVLHVGCYWRPRCTVQSLNLEASELLNVKWTSYKALTIKTNFIGCTNNVREEATWNKDKGLTNRYEAKGKYLLCSKGSVFVAIYKYV